MGNKRCSSEHKQCGGSGHPLRGVHFQPQRVHVYLPDFPAAHWGRLSLIIALPEWPSKTQLARPTFQFRCQEPPQDP
jgi:hypothetical protein